MGPAIVAKVSVLEKMGISIDQEANEELAVAVERDALLVLEALSMRMKKDGVKNPSKFVVTSLRKRAENAASVPLAKAPVAKMPATKAPVTNVVVTKAPVTKAPVTKAPVANVPVAKAPVAKAPVVKAPVVKQPVAKTPIAKISVSHAPIAKVAVAKTLVAKAPVAKALVSKDAGKPPKLREGLNFDEAAVQAKLLSLNSHGVWEGNHPLDEEALAALLRIEPGRSLEILEEVEELGGNVVNPSSFVLNQVAETEMGR